MQVIDAPQVEDKVGTKRRNDKELLNDKMKVMKISAPVDKENIENHVRKEVEKYLAPIRQKMELMR